MAKVKKEDGVANVAEVKKVKKETRRQKKLEQSKEGKLSGRQKLILALSGAVIGFVNGFFGGGGGMICVPLLEKVLHLPNKYSHATAIAVILPISLVSACVYLFCGSLQSLPLLSVGAGVIAGGVVGSFALKFLPAKVVRVIFALVMLAGGLRMIF